VRVGAPGKDAVTLTTFCAPPTLTPFTIAGVNTVNMRNHHMAASVTITGPGIPAGSTAKVDPMTGTWSFTSTAITTLPASVTVTSAQGGTVTANAALCPILQLRTTAPPPTSTPKTAVEQVDRFKPEPPKAKTAPTGANQPQ
jgi:hypothetical protein